MKISDAKVIELPKFLDRRGNLSFLEENVHIPFSIQRSYWIYDVPGGFARGGHAYRENEEFIIALSGSFDVVLNDATESHVFSLNRSYYGLYIPRGLWREINNFSTNSLALIVASKRFNKRDYIYDFEEYRKSKLRQ